MREMKRGKMVLKNHHEQKNAKDLQENGSGNQRIISYRPSDN